MTAACEACRNLKMRCSRSETGDEPNDYEPPCDRCKRHNRPCKVPAPRSAGRKQGSRGRYQGVEKALRKIQYELRKAKTVPTANGESQEVLGLIISNTGGDARQQTAQTRQDVQPVSPDSTSVSMVHAYQTTSLSGRLLISQPLNESQIPHQQPVTNPMGLVADACDEAHNSSRPSDSIASPSAVGYGSVNLSRVGGVESDDRDLHLLKRPGYISLGLTLDRPVLEQALDVLLTCEIPRCQYLDYFTPVEPSKHRDLGPHLDPIGLCLLTLEEACHLFEVFFSRLHPINGILDPHLHTPAFVRNRSALLFTWILAIAAQFSHDSGVLATRLRNHGNFLSGYVHSNGYKSVEIVQGYYVSLLSPAPADNMAEERTWLYTNHAFGVAAELGLDKRSRPIDPARNSRPDLGFDDTETTHAERIARNRERTWLRILLWERAHSAARGRMGAFPENELMLNIQTWYIHPLADPSDKYTCAFILLRRHLVVLINEMQKQQEFRQRSRHWVKELVNNTLNPWCQAWISAPDTESTPSAFISNTYLRYVYMHGRLWILSFALHSHVQACKSGGMHSRNNSIKEDCFEAAVNCCEAAVRNLTEIGEPLYPMLAPTWAMITYAAVLALRLFPLLYGSRQGAEIELLALLTKVALLLEKAGTTPTHRFGIAALLGQHLFKVLRTRASGLGGGDGVGATSQGPSQAQRSVTEDIDLDFVANPPEHDAHLAFDPLFAAFDSYLALPFLPGDEGDTNEGFTGALSDWMNQGFVSIP